MAHQSIDTTARTQGVPHHCTARLYKAQMSKRYSWYWRWNEYCKITTGACRIRSKQICSNKERVVLNYMHYLHAGGVPEDVIVPVEQIFSSAYSMEKSSGTIISVCVPVTVVHPSLAATVISLDTPG